MYDVIFIGSGHASWHGAVTLAQAGKKVVQLAEKLLEGGSPGLLGLLLTFTLNFSNHHLARLERDGFVFVDPNFNAGAGVARVTSGANLNFKDAKITELDTTVLNKDFDNGFKSFLDNLFRLLLRKIGLLGDQANDFFFGHLIPLSLYATCGSSLDSQMQSKSVNLITKYIQNCKTRAIFVKSFL